MASQCDTAAVTRPRVNDLNHLLTCRLCDGYLIDATTVDHCLHSFCRSCIVQYLRSNGCCPLCVTAGHPRSRNGPPPAIRSDKLLQTLVYKMVPSLFDNEMKRRRDFYSQRKDTDTGVSGESRGDPWSRTPHVFTDHQPVQLQVRFPDPRRDILDDPIRGIDREAVHDPGSADGVPGSAVHDPGSADSVPGSAVRVSGPADSVPGSAIRVPGCSQRFLLCTAATLMSSILKLLRLKLLADKAENHDMYDLELVASGEVLVESHWTVADLAYILQLNPVDSIKLDCRLVYRNRSNLECSPSKSVRSRPVPQTPQPSCGNPSKKRTIEKPTNDIQVKRYRLSSSDYKRPSLADSSNVPVTFKCLLKRSAFTSVGSPLLAHSYRKSKLVTAVSNPVALSYSSGNIVPSTKLLGRPDAERRSLYMTVSSSMESSCALSHQVSPGGSIPQGQGSRLYRVSDSRLDLKRLAADSERVSFVTDKLQASRHTAKLSNTVSKTSVIVSTTATTSLSSPPVVLKFWKTVANSKVLYTTTPSPMCSKASVSLPLDRSSCCKSVDDQRSASISDATTSAGIHFSSCGPTRTIGREKSTVIFSDHVMTQDSATPATNHSSSLSDVQHLKNHKKNSTRLHNIISSLTRSRANQSLANTALVSSTPLQKYSNIDYRSTGEESIPVSSSLPVDSIYCCSNGMKCVSAIPSDDKSVGKTNQSISKRQEENGPEQNVNVVNDILDSCSIESESVTIIKSANKSHGLSLPSDPCTVNNNVFNSSVDVLTAASSVTNSDASILSITGTNVSATTSSSTIIMSRTAPSSITSGPSTSSISSTASSAVTSTVTISRTASSAITSPITVSISRTSSSAITSDPSTVSITGTSSVINSGHSTVSISRTASSTITSDSSTAAVNGVSSITSVGPSVFASIVAYPSTSTIVSTESLQNIVSSSHQTILQRCSESSPVQASTSDCYVASRAVLTSVDSERSNIVASVPVTVNRCDGHLTAENDPGKSHLQNISACSRSQTLSPQIQKPIVSLLSRTVDDCSRISAQTRGVLSFTIAESAASSQECQTEGELRTKAVRVAGADSPVIDARQRVRQCSSNELLAASRHGSPVLRHKVNDPTTFPGALHIPCPRVTSGGCSRKNLAINDHAVAGSCPSKHVGRELPIRIPKYPLEGFSLQQPCSDNTFKAKDIGLLPIFSTDESLHSASSRFPKVESQCNLSKNVKLHSASSACGVDTTGISTQENNMNPLDLSIRSQPIICDDACKTRMKQVPDRNVFSHKYPEMKHNTSRFAGQSSEYPAPTLGDPDHGSSTNLFNFHSPPNQSIRFLQPASSFSPLSVFTDLTSSVADFSRLLATQQQQQLALLHYNSLMSSPTAWDPAGCWSSAGRLKKSSPVAGCPAPVVLSPPGLTAAVLSPPGITNVVLSPPGATAARVKDTAQTSTQLHG